MGGALTGKGADLAIIDDVMKASEVQSPIERDGVYQWSKSSLMSRFDVPAMGRVPVVMQRLHNDDLIGRLLAEEGWTSLCLPAEAAVSMEIPQKTGIWSVSPGQLLFPQRFNGASLVQLKRDLGEAAYNAQILQAPSPPGGFMIKLKWFNP